MRISPARNRCISRYYLSRTLVLTRPWSLTGLFSNTLYLSKLIMAEAIGLIASIIAIGQLVGSLPKVVEIIKPLAEIKEDVALLLNEVC